MTTLKNLKGTAIQFLDADPVVYVGLGHLVDLKIQELLDIVLQEYKQLV